MRIISHIIAGKKSAFVKIFAKFDLVEKFLFHHVQNSTKSKRSLPVFKPKQKLRPQSFLGVMRDAMKHRNSK